MLLIYPQQIFIFHPSLIRDLLLLNLIYYILKIVKLYLDQILQSFLILKDLFKYLFEYQLNDHYQLDHSIKYLLKFVIKKNLPHVRFLLAFVIYLNLIKKQMLNLFLHELT